MGLEDLRGRIDIAIICVRPEEKAELLKRFPVEETVTGEHEYLISHLFRDDGKEMAIAVVRSGEALISQSTMCHIIKELDPLLTLVVGIAGGISHKGAAVLLGDVAVSTGGLDASPGELDPPGRFRSKPSPFELSHWAVELVRDLVVDQGWKEVKIRRPAVELVKLPECESNWYSQVERNFSNRETQEPQHFLGTFSSGPTFLRDDRKASKWRKIVDTANYPPLVAHEMELIGVHQASFNRFRRHNYLAIKGISDIIGLERDLAWRPYAAATAASFAFHFMKTLTFDPKGCNGLPLLASPHHWNATILSELSDRSLEMTRPLDARRSAWINRPVDSRLADSEAPVVFLVAGSGQGKSVACFRRARRFKEAGGAAFIISEHLLSKAQSPEQLVALHLQEFQPGLHVLDSPDFGQIDTSVLVVIDDICRWSEPEALLSKLLRWARSATDQRRWQFLCPLKPEFLFSSSEQVLRELESFLIPLGGYTPEEGREAVLALARAEGSLLSDLEASTVAEQLAYDPLLIGLRDGRTGEPLQVISGFVERCIVRASKDCELTASDIRLSLQTVCAAMLADRTFRPTWAKIKEWTSADLELRDGIRAILAAGELARLEGLSTQQSMDFRHDRVRDWLLAEALVNLSDHGDLSDEIIGEPYFARILGCALTIRRDGQLVVDRVAAANPLALFSYLKYVGSGSLQRTDSVLASAKEWLAHPGNHSRQFAALRATALTFLSETDSPHVLTLTKMFADKTWSKLLAQLRNGCVVAGIRLCASFELSSKAPWLERVINHAYLHHRVPFIKALAKRLRKEDIDARSRRGALRLSVYLADRSLLSPIDDCWRGDPERSDNLVEYILAYSRCCRDDPSAYLDAVCAHWGGLSDEPEKEGGVSPRGAVASFGLRFALRCWAPKMAVEYLVERASVDLDLRGVIASSLCQVDLPEAVVFIARDRARITKGDFFPFFRFHRDWERAQECGRPMSAQSRAALLGLWRSDTTSADVRREAFALWDETIMPDDLEVLAEAADEQLRELILKARLRRADEDALADVADRLRGESADIWWGRLKHYRADPIIPFLKTYLEERREQFTPEWHTSTSSDWSVADIFRRMPPEAVEPILLAHWDQLRFNGWYVKVALFTATPPLVDCAISSVNDCPAPAQLLSHLASIFGPKTNRGPDLRDQQQILNLEPIARFLSELDVYELWCICNEKGWLEARRAVLDPHIKPKWRGVWCAAGAGERLDQLLNRGNGTMEIRVWLESYLESLVPWRVLLDSILAWVAQVRTWQSVEMAAEAILSAGSYEELQELAQLSAEFEGPVEEIIQDCTFALALRGLV